MVAVSFDLGRTRLAFARRIPGLKSETWGTLRVSIRNWCRLGAAGLLVGIGMTFELWGQKHVIHAGLLAAGDLDWMSNVNDAQPDSAGTLQARTLLYERAPSMPVESMLIGNLHADVPNAQETFATAIGSLRRCSVICAS